MGEEINLYRLYPQPKRNLGDRALYTDEDRAIAKQFGFDYFDGDRRRGYGGYNYHPRFWTDTVKLFRDHYQLAPDAAILDIGCAKGFMLYDFSLLMPQAKLAGVDVSEYAIQNAKPEMKSCVQVANATKLPFPDKSFDLIICINTLHNLPREGVIQGLHEIERVTRKHAFLMVDGWYNDDQKNLMAKWVLTAATMMHGDEWKKLFQEAGYTHDYFFWTVS